MTDTTNTTAQQDPAEIERDIRRTQDEMSRTVDKIGTQLTPRNLMNSLLDTAEANNIDARYLLDGARRNPLALAMIAGGAIWLVSDSDAKLPSRHSGSGRSTNTDDHYDPVHRDYVQHMNRIEWRDGEEQAIYQRRRDLARANYFMLEQRHDEDDHSFRQRLDDMAEKLRAKRHAWAESGSSAAQGASDRMRGAAGSVRNAGNAAIARTQNAFTDNPLVGGLVAAAAGALFGGVLPTTQTEDEQLGELGRKARERAGEQKDRLADKAGEKARETKDEFLTRVQEHAEPSAARSDGSGPDGSAAPQSRGYIEEQQRAVEATQAVPT